MVIFHSRALITSTWTELAVAYAVLRSATDEEIGKFESVKSEIKKKNTTHFGQTGKYSTSIFTSVQ